MTNLLRKSPFQRAIEFILWITIALCVLACGFFAGVGWMMK